MVDLPLRQCSPFLLLESFLLKPRWNGHHFTTEVLAAESSQRLPRVSSASRAQSDSRHSTGGRRRSDPVELGMNQELSPGIPKSWRVHLRMGKPWENHRFWPQKAWFLSWKIPSRNGWLGIPPFWIGMIGIKKKCSSTGSTPVLEKWNTQRNSPRILHHRF